MVVVGLGRGGLRHGGCGSVVGEAWWCSGGLWVVGFDWLLLLCVCVCVCFFGCGSGVVFVAGVWWFVCAFLLLLLLLLVVVVVVVVVLVSGFGGFFNGFASWHGGYGGGCWPMSGGLNGM